MMMQKRFAVLGALVCALSLFNGDRAEASYNYSTSLAITSVTGGATFTNGTTGAQATLDGTTLFLANVARTGFGVPSVSTVNIGDVGVSSTATPGGPGTSFTVTYTDTIALTNVPPPGNTTGSPGSITLTGTITLSGVTSGTGIISNAYIISFGTTTVGTIPFSVAGTNFGNPTINGAPGTLGGQITAVPEPASIVMLGLGVGVLGVVGLRRRFRSA